MSLDVVYSPLCDTDRSVYLAYLIVKYGHGGCTGVVDEVRGGDCDGKTGCGGVDLGSRFVAAYSSACSAAGVRPADMGVRGRGVAGGGATRVGVGSPGKGGQGAGVGVPDCHGGGSGGSVVVGGVGTTNDSDDSSVGEILRGRHYRRNSRNRARRKACGVVTPVSPVTPVSFMSEIGDDLRAALVKSRAEMYIAENVKRKAVAESFASNGSSRSTSPKVPVEVKAAVSNPVKKSLDYRELTKAEKFMVDRRFMTVAVEKARGRYGRSLSAVDFTTGDEFGLDRENKIRLSGIY